MTTIYDRLGGSMVHHAGFFVARGKLTLAAAFFDQLNWHIFNQVTIRGDPGPSIFVQSRPHKPYVQLTDAGTSLPTMAPKAVHLSISVISGKARLFAEEMVDWAKTNGCGDNVVVEPVGKLSGRCYVTIPSLFLFTIELFEVSSFRSR